MPAKHAPPTLCPFDPSDNSVLKRTFDHAHKNLRNLIPWTSRQFLVKENFKESFLYQTGVADSEKGTPEAKFRPFFHHF